MAHYHRLNKAEELNKFLVEYRSTPHTSTGLPPGDVLFRAGYINGITRALPNKDILDQAKEADKKSKSISADRYNNRKFTFQHTYIQGQEVLVKNSYRTKKFEPFFEPEPYCIMSIAGDFLELERDSDGRQLIRHRNHVK